MAKTIPFPRSAQATRPRRSKAMLLPMPRPVADELALQAHLVLATLRGDAGTCRDVQTLLQTQVLTLTIANAGYGMLTPEEARRADEALIACFDRGRQGGGWCLGDEAFDALARIVTVYDSQLHTAPLWALSEASERLDRMSAGVDDQSLERKLA